MKEKCNEKVWGGWDYHSCPRNVWEDHLADGFCKQHHPDTVKARKEKAEARWKAKMESSPLSKAMRRIAEIEAEIERLKGKP